MKKIFCKHWDHVYFLTLLNSELIFKDDTEDEMTISFLLFYILYCLQHGDCLIKDQGSSKQEYK